MRKIHTEYWISCLFRCEKFPSVKNFTLAPLLMLVTNMRYGYKMWAGIGTDLVRWIILWNRIGVFHQIQNANIFFLRFVSPLWKCTSYLAMFSIFFVKWYLSLCKASTARTHCSRPSPNWWVEVYTRGQTSSFLYSYLFTKNTFTKRPPKRKARFPRYCSNCHTLPSCSSFF